MNHYRQAWYDHAVPYLYEHEPDALSQHDLDLYEDMLETLADNRREMPHQPSATGNPVTLPDYDRQDLMDAVGAFNGDLPWNDFSRAYYFDHMDEVLALAG